MKFEVNHITLAVTDLSVSLDFYCKVLKFKQIHVWEGGAYLEAGRVWICLTVSDSVSAKNDYTHLAFSIDSQDFSTWENVFRVAGVESWRENESEGPSIYFLDPDGHKLELHVGNLASRMRHIQGQLKRSQGCGTDA